ncbi:unnamed protein product [Phaedon cochleariae]|uniref:Uncharacterized protein n=1 Tax=Phaedon cochleariae TaxID=80249 RepID=A0A9N9X5R1_PHACE|nr:unnamed protein product [Phaedon cochleariae]
MIYNVSNNFHLYSISCLTEKASKTIENSMNETISLFGVNLIRNEEKLNSREGKSLQGFNRVLKAISNFLDTHTFSIDLTEPRSLSSEGGTPKKGGGGGFFNMNTKALRREKKYYQYAFMVLLGIFGLTGPLVMQVLGIMAAKSLLAAKTALIIVGGVALKKIFEHGGDKSPKVKITTLPLHQDKYESEEDHDRWGHGFNHIPYGYGYEGNNPYSAYSTMNEKADYAPVIYGINQKTKVLNSR